MTLTDYREVLRRLYDQGECATAMEAIARDAQHFPDDCSDMAEFVAAEQAPAGRPVEEEGERLSRLFRLRVWPPTLL